MDVNMKYFDTYCVLGLSYDRSEAHRKVVLERAWRWWELLVPQRVAVRAS